MTPRSWLFVPGDSPRKLEKAASCGSDALIIDLEDSVAEPSKEAARATTRAFLGHPGTHACSIWVRVNSLRSGMIEQDLRAVASPELAGIVLPKCEGDNDLSVVCGLLAEAESRVGAGTLKILPLVTETARSIFTLGTYSRSSARLDALTWGAEDLSAAVGAISPRDGQGRLTAPYQLARSLCLFAAAASGVPAIETVYPAFSDVGGLANFAAEARRDGFMGMMAIHPSQILAINAAFTPTQEEVSHAQDIVALFEASPGRGTVTLRGQMIDRPHLMQAERVLQRWLRVAAVRQAPIAPSDPHAE